MKKAITIVQIIFFGIIFFIQKPTPILADQTCTGTVSYPPTKQTFTGDVFFTLSDPNWKDGERYQVKIDCGNPFQSPTSSIGVVLNHKTIVTISPATILERSCLQDTWRTGPKNIVLITAGVGVTCPFAQPKFQTIADVCALVITPKYVKPGDKITISSVDAPDKLGLRLNIKNSSNQIVQVETAGAKSFSKTITTPSKLGNYLVNLSIGPGPQAAPEEIYCKSAFGVTFDPNNPTNPINPPFEPCNILSADRTKCNECVNTKNGMWTALGCIPRDINALMGWILSNAIILGGGITFLLMIFGAFQIIISGGDPEKINGGKEVLTSAIAGLLMIIFSVVILKIIGYDILRIPGISL